MRNRLQHKKRNMVWIVCTLILLLAGMILTFIAGYPYQMEAYLFYRNLLVFALVMLLIAFSFWLADKKEMLFSWNRGHIVRYTLVICLAVFFLYGMGYVPFMAAPISAIAIILTVFSGSMCGIFSYLGLILQYCLLQEVSNEQLLVLLVTGLLGSILFSSLDRNFRYAGALFAYLAGEVICYGSFFLITEQGTAFGDLMLFLCIHLFVALVGVLIILKLLGVLCIYRDVRILSVLNDPEYSLLAQLKDMDKDAYFHAIHTAYLSEKAARRIGINAPLAKAGGYYHKIGLLQGSDSIRNTILVGNANHFPDSLICLLKEFGIKNIKHVSGEAAIVQIADVVVSTISYMFQKDNKAVLDYGKIVDVIIKKKLETGDFDYCQLTMEELSEIKKCFAEEKLYYDFLR